MKASALAISMILILVPLAGCSGTDTEVNVDLSNEDINDLIDENLEDVMNNTTVVVFQEYHNNTTVVNQYTNNSTSNVDQSGASSSTTTYNYNGSAGESELFVIRLEFDFSDFVGEIALKRNNNFTIEFSYFDYATNNDRTDNFTLQCSNYYEAPVQGSNSTSTNPPYWNSNGDVQDDYTDWWDYLYNNTIRDLLTEMAYNGDVEDVKRVARAESSVVFGTTENGDEAKTVARPESSVVFKIIGLNGTYRASARGLILLRGLRSPCGEHWPLKLDRGPCGPLSRVP